MAQPSSSNVSVAAQQGALVNRPHTSVSYKIHKSKMRVPGQSSGEECSPLPPAPALSASQQPQAKNAQQLPIKQNVSPQKMLPDIKQKTADSGGAPGSINAIANGKPPYLNFLKSKGNENNLNIMSTNDFQEVLLKEKDERFRYLLKHGTLKRIEGNGNIIFSELPQIPGIWVCYRRPQEREGNLEKLNLDYMELNHIPLLEGEEKLKILTYQHNRVCKIENLVSLPTLLYIDLYDNMIREIENLTALPQLRVLLLPKNQISKIKNLDCLTKLEVLDLHSNKIQKIEGIQKLPNLRILNLANNLLTKIEFLDSQTALVELNLKINLIEQLENIQHLAKLEKLFVSNNRIQDTDSFGALKPLVSLVELNLDGNPISKLKFDYARAVLLSTKNLQVLDHRSVDSFREEIKIEESKLSQDKKREQQKDKEDGSQASGIGSASTASGAAGTTSSSNGGGTAKGTSSKRSGVEASSSTTNAAGNDDEEDENINPEEVIEIIGQQWEKELERVKKLDMQNVSKKEVMKGTLVEGGHAEIEDDSILFIFGNAYEIVLSNPTFQESIEKIQFQYIIFDFLIDSHTLATLKNFRKLREIVLKDNYVSSLLQLAKLEILPSLRHITIENSPLCKCSFLKEFIVYRFPLISKINGKDVKEVDRQRAKTLFHHFDRILQLPEKFYNVENVREYPFECAHDAEIKKDKHYMKLFTKLVNENSDRFVQTLLPSVVEQKEREQVSSDTLDLYVLGLIRNTVGAQLERAPLH